MKTRRYNIDTEHHEQVTLMSWVNHNLRAMPELHNLFAIPNGGHRHLFTAQKMKAEGVKPGVPDMFLAHPSGDYCGLFVEMKRRKGGVLSPVQREWIERLSKSGYRVVVCLGWGDAKKEIIEYLKLETK